MEKANHIPHGILLKPKLVGEVKENILNLFSRYGYLTIGRPGGIRFSRTRNICERALVVGTGAHMRVYGGSIVTLKLAGVLGAASSCYSNEVL